MSVTLAAFTWSSAGETAPIEPVRFTVFAARPLTEVAMRTEAGVMPALEFYPTSRSPRYEYREPMPMIFVDRQSGEPVAEVHVPVEIRVPLLLFSDASPGRGGVPARLRYHVAVVDDSVGQRGPGTLAIINFSGLELDGSVASTRLSLGPGLSPSWNIGGAAQLRLRSTRAGRARQAFSGGISLDPDQRALLILFPPYYRGSMEVQSRLLIDTPDNAKSPP